MFINVTETKEITPTQEELCDQLFLKGFNSILNCEPFDYNISLDNTCMPFSHIYERGRMVAIYLIKKYPIDGVRKLNLNTIYRIGDKLYQEGVIR